MEDIVHFKYVSESYQLHKEELVDEEIVESPFDDIGELVELPGSRQKVMRSTHREINQDEFKKGLSANESVSIDRITIVVTEDYKKNTVSLKIFKMYKVTVPVKNCERKKFKKVNHHMDILTINKTTGDFSIYTNNYNRRKYYATVRKNIITSKLKNILNNMVKGVNHDTFGAISKFYEVLGYKPLVLYKDFFNEYLPPISDTYFNPKEYASLPFFPFVNYVLKSNIKEFSFEFLPIFEYIFKREKKKFFNRSMFDYIKHYHNIKNDELSELLIENLKLQTIIAHENNAISYALTKPNEKHGVSFVYPGINANLIEFINIFNIPIKQIKSSELLRFKLITNDFFNTSYERALPMDVYRIIDLYNFNPIEFIDYYLDNTDRCSYFCYQLMKFHEFGVRLKLKSIIDYSELKDQQVFKIFDALCVARGETGTFTVNNSFILNLRKFLPSKYELIIAHNVKPNKLDNTNYYLDDRTGEGEQKYKRVYEWQATRPMLGIFNIATGRWFFTFALSQTIGRTDIKLISADDKESKESIEDFIRGQIRDNKVMIKQIYSRNYFEEFLQKQFSLTASDWLVYLD